MLRALIDAFFQDPHWKDAVVYAVFVLNARWDAMVLSLTSLIAELENRG